MYVYVYIPHSKEKVAALLVELIHTSILYMNTYIHTYMHTYTYIYTPQQRESRGALGRAYLYIHHTSIYSINTSIHPSIYMCIYLAARSEESRRSWSSLLSNRCTMACMCAPSARTCPYVHTYNIHTCMHACMHAYIRAYIHTYICTHTHTQTRKNTHTHICEWV